ncbi:hypothetical protein ABZP36_008141 [Zizania latifolia]
MRSLLTVALRRECVRTPDNGATRRASAHIPGKMLFPLSWAVRWIHSNVYTFTNILCEWDLLCICHRWRDVVVSVVRPLLKCGRITFPGADEELLRLIEELHPLYPPFPHSPFMPPSPLHQPILRLGGCTRSPEAPDPSTPPLGARSLFMRYAVKIGLHHNPVWRDCLFYDVLAGAFAHGTYLIFSKEYKPGPSLFCFVFFNSARQNDGAAQESMMMVLVVKGYVKTVELLRHPYFQSYLVESEMEASALEGYYDHIELRTLKAWMETIDIVTAFLPLQRVMASA